MPSASKTPECFRLWRDVTSQVIEMFELNSYRCKRQLIRQLHEQTFNISLEHWRNIPSGTNQYRLTWGNPVGQVNMPFISDGGYITAARYKLLQHDPMSGLQKILGTDMLINWLVNINHNVELIELAKSLFKKGE